MLKDKSIVFVDKNAELQYHDKKVLEELGYTVITIIGDPYKAIRLETKIVEEA